MVYTIKLFNIQRRKKWWRTDRQTNKQNFLSKTRPLLWKGSIKKRRIYLWKCKERLLQLEVGPQFDTAPCLDLTSDWMWETFEGASNFWTFLLNGNVEVSNQNHQGYWITESEIWISTKDESYCLWKIWESKSNPESCTGRYEELTFVVIESMVIGRWWCRKNLWRGASTSKSI